MSEGDDVSIPGTTCHLECGHSSCHLCAAPDRPGDRDQQQAAKVRRAIYSLPFPLADARIAAALAAARAEEAARWRAKIEALPAVGTLHGDPVVSLRALRAVLDAS